MHKAKLFSFAAFAWLLGIGIGELSAPSFFTLYVLALFAGGCMFFFRQSTYWRTLLLFVLLLVVGALYATIRTHQVNIESVEYYNNSFKQISGTVDMIPDVRDTHQKITLSDVYIDNDLKKGKLLVLISKEKKIDFNNQLATSCYLEFPEQIEGYAYNNYLARFNIYSVCAFPKSISVSTNHKPHLFTEMYRIRSSIETNIKKSIREPEASLVLGILLGDKKGLGEGLTTVFKKAGLSHIVALSGYNISVLVTVLLLIGRELFIPRRLLFGIMLASIFSFVIMTGSSPSVIRAGVMGMVILFAYEIRRLPHSLNILFAVAIVMVLINPKILLWDVGWQLSFIATYSIIEFVPLLQYRFRAIPSIVGLRDAVIVTITAVTTTAPLVVWHFGGVSLISLIANLAIVPVIPLLMASGFVTGILGSNVPFSFFWVMPTIGLSAYVIQVATFLSKIPFSYIKLSPEFGVISSSSVLALVIFYIVKNKYAGQTT